MTDININNDDQFITELMNAIKKQSLDEVESIGDNYSNVQDVDINKQNGAGDTVFMKAAYFKNIEILKFLY